MSAEDPNHYSIEPHDDANERTPPAPSRPHDVQRAGAPDPFQLEGEKVAGSTPRPSRTKQSHVKGLDVCPNCGSPMPDTKTLVCLRCGYDLKKLEVIKTATGEAVVEEAEEPEETLPLTTGGRGDLWLPGALAAAAGVLLLVGYLAGATTLFPAIEEDPVPASARFIGLLRAALLILIWTVCGVAGLMFVARLVERPVGDLKLAGMRMLGIAAAMRLVTYLHVGPPAVDWPVQALGQAAVFCGLTIALFGLTLRDAATATLATLLGFVALWIVALAVIWAAGSGF